MDATSNSSDVVNSNIMPSIRTEADLIAQATIARTALAEFTAVQGFNPEMVRAAMEQLVKATVCFSFHCSFADLH
jgi:hypothetical protein